MKTFTAILLAIIFLLASISTVTVSAQKGGDEGYSVDEGYPVETTEPPEPTPEPPQPTPEAPQPTPEPPQPTPEPQKPTPDPTEAAPQPTAATAAPTKEPEDPHPACDGLKIHPVIEKISEHYQMPYEDLLEYFCDYNLGVMEIKLLLETFIRAAEEIGLDEILSMRVDEGRSWVDIWLTLGLKETPNFDEVGQSEAFRKNDNRNGYNHQASNPGADS